MVGEGGLAWLLGQAHLTLSRRRKPPTFPAGTGVLDEQVCPCETGFHCLETTRSQPYGLAFLSAPLGSDGINFVFVGALSGGFFFYRLESNYSSQGPYLRGSKNVWEMEKKKTVGKEEVCVCVCMRVCACVSPNTERAGVAW